MPPRTAPLSTGGGGAGRGAGRGRGRGGTPISWGSSASNNPNAPQISNHVTTVGVKRPAYGVSGRPIAVYANCFETTIPEKTIYHYDVDITGEKALPARLNMLIIKALQEVVARDVFITPAVYDGRKNMFSTHILFPEHSRTFDVTLAAGKPPPAGAGGGKPPKLYKVKITQAASINPELLRRFIEGSQSNDEKVATAIMALNIVIRMDPTQKYPFNVRSFFPGKETKMIGSGIELCRGYFQSVRPAIGRMVINVDISTGMFFRPGLLTDLILDFVGERLGNPSVLSTANPRGLGDVRNRRNLGKFLIGVRVNVITGEAPAKPGAPTRPPRAILALSDKDADQIFFAPSQGGRMISVADYFKQLRGRPLKYPKIVCVAVGNKDSWVPIELLAVVSGQLMRKEVPSDRTKDVVEFSTKAPKERLASIRQAFSVLKYGDSPYVQNFGMQVEENPMEIKARVLKHPTLQYGVMRGKPTKVNPANGAWNMREKKFYRPAKVGRWLVIIFESERRFDARTATEMVKSFSAACNEYGMLMLAPNPEISWGNPRGSIMKQLKDAGKAVVDKYKEAPALLVVILPEQGDEIWREVKHFGDIEMGVPTQCMKANKCGRGKPQYFANVCLKLNGKLGGINTIPDPETERSLTDPNNPAIVMGADVFHPAPGSVGRPSFAALVGSVDSEAAKYVADVSVQDGSFSKRIEMITGLKDMTKGILIKYMQYRVQQEKKKMSEAPPKRLIFYRDGISEGEFPKVLEVELPQIKAACAELKINPKITLIIVGKRHHIRFFPKNEGDAGDKLGNCPAGTIIDREIGHPTEFDFYLQSHGGLLGTSRPAHYSVLHDENAFPVDALQALSFTLCHVYAPSTRSVSIPAPVYYADRVCGRAKNHFHPDESLDGSDTASRASNDDGTTLMKSIMNAFKPINSKQSNAMFFL